MYLISDDFDDQPSTSGLLCNKRGMNMSQTLDQDTVIRVLNQLLELKRAGGEIQWALGQTQTIEEGA
jgi:hypothetical protein